MPANHYIKTIHGLFAVAGLEQRKEEILLRMCDKTSVSALTDDQARAFVAWLQEEAKRRRQPMRNTIIYYLCLLGYTIKGTDNPDFDRINKFIEEIGSNNPRKVILNFLTYHELVDVVSQVKAMYRTETAKARAK